MTLCQDWSANVKYAFTNTVMACRVMACVLFRVSLGFLSHWPGHWQPSVIGGRGGIHGMAHTKDTANTCCCSLEVYSLQCKRGEVPRQASHRQQPRRSTPAAAANGPQSQAGLCSIHPFTAPCSCSHCSRCNVVSG